MLIGDWNGKVGSIDNGWEATMGKYGYSKYKDRGEALLQFALDNNMVICNTFPTERRQKVVTKSAYNQQD